MFDPSMSRSGHLPRQSQSSLAEAEGRVSFARAWLRSAATTGQLPTAGAAAYGRVRADKIGVLCKPVGVAGFAPRMSLIVHAKKFEKHIAVDGDWRASCQALADAGFMTDAQHDDHRRSLPVAAGVLPCYQVFSDILRVPGL